MKPHIDGTAFGSITISGKTYDYDILMRLNGKVKKRRKGLSRAKYGTSHIVSLEEAEQVYEAGAKRLIVGSGQYGNVELSQDAEDFFGKKGCEVELLPTPEAAIAWNAAKGETIGLFHVTC